MELLKIGTHFIWKTSDRNRVVDRCQVLQDLYWNELQFQEQKKQMIESYLEIYEHILDPKEQRRVSQLIINFISLRPLLDFEDPYFIHSYTSQIKVLELEWKLLRDLISTFLRDQNYISHIHKDRSLERTGFPDPLLLQSPLQFFPSSSTVGILDFHDSISVIPKFSGSPSFSIYLLNMK
jgi:hypothetical protein